jgi:hypothetical protein
MVTKHEKRRKMNFRNLISLKQTRHKWIKEKTQQKKMNKLLIYYLHFYFNSKDKPIKMQLETCTLLSFFLSLPCKTITETVKRYEVGLIV